MIKITTTYLHIVRNGSKIETEVKQAVRKKINKKRYLYPLTVSLPGGVDGLYTLRSSHEEVFT